MKVLIVLTSRDKLGDTGRKTGFWLEELAAPYYTFKEAGAEITLASPKGGQPPLDPKSNEPDFQTDETRRFEADAEAVAALSSTIRLADVDQADFDTVFYPGGHGPLWDLAEDPKSISIIESFLAAKKPVATVNADPLLVPRLYAVRRECFFEWRTPWPQNPMRHRCAGRGGPGPTNLIPPNRFDTVAVIPFRSS